MAMVEGIMLEKSRKSKKLTFKNFQVPRLHYNSEKELDGLWCRATPVCWDALCDAGNQNNNL